MIFVTVGTNEAPFDRLVGAVDSFGSDDVLTQFGHARVRPSRGRGVAFLPFEEMAEQMHRADAVVMHAGAGSALLALSNGVVPILVPRLHAFGEAVDDHQVAFARRLADRGLARVVENLGDLAAEASKPMVRRAPIALNPGSLVLDLRTYLDAAVDRRRHERHPRTTRTTEVQR